MKDQRDTRKGGHYATGEVSVTTVLKMISAPALTMWLQKEIFNATLDGAKDFSEANKVVGDISRAAMSIGTRVHDFVEHYKTDIVPVRYIEDALYYQAFFQWISDYNPIFLERETTVTSKKYGYKGTLDLIAEIDGVRKLVDLKTGKYVYETVELQTSAYKLAYQEERPEEENKIEETWVLLLEKGGDGQPTGKYKYKQTEYVPEIFLSTLDIYNWKRNMKK